MRWLSLRLSRFWWLVRNWWRHRDFRYLLQGLPAILVGGGVLAVSLAAYLRTNDELVVRYLGRAKTLFHAKDYAGALADLRAGAAMSDFVRDHTVDEIKEAEAGIARE